MKKVFGIAALLLALAACNKETEITPVEQVEQPSDSKGITITATLAPKTADTKAVADNGDNKITVTWAKNEHIAILYTVGSTKKVADAEITAVDGSGVATITFTVDGGTTNDTPCTLVYPLSAAKDDKSGVKDAATLLSAQDGTLNANLDVRVGAGTIRTTTPGLDVTTQPEAQFAIFKFTLSGPSIDATHPLVIKDNASNKTITTVTPASTATSVYAAMPAADSKAYKFVVITADNKYIKSGTAAITAGNYYQTSLSMSPRYPLALSSATAEWDLGAVACNDGQLYMEKKAAPAGKTALGIVGKVTSEGHGLILALQDATSQTWNTINGWTSTDTYAGTELKVLPDDAARGANLTSYTALGTTAVSNWAVAHKSDYVAIFTNLGSTTGDKTYDANVNAYITTGVGGTAITGGNWSATEVNDGSAWYFGSDYWSNFYKTNSRSIRPVLGFGGEAAPAARTLAEATPEDLGKIAGADGNIYDTKAAAEAAGTTAVAMIAYLGSGTDHATYTHGLAIALSDEASTMNWSPAKTTCEGKTAVTGAEWKLPTQIQWKAMFKANGGNEGKYTSLNTAITTAGGTVLQVSGYYWSSTEIDGDYARSVYLGGGDADWIIRDKGYVYRVRACLAF